ncbi:uncharacterized protein PFLUO_LOCUS2993 [Penicillium psychrofluorescens]|uniref:uncharacterized protein n=1 Tax=Penicillium psychrofluorescens TaxID=3158075 RepID=UPI003CCD21C4
MATTKPNLTTNDAAVLQALFDAESSPSSGVVIDPSLSPWPSSVSISEQELASLKEREASIIRQISGDNPTREIVESAVADFDALIETYPTYPSAYTNRAQTLRLLVDIQEESKTKNTDSASDDTLFTSQSSSLATRIFNDLGQAISLATPRSPADPVSNTQARLLADVHTHRGYLLLKAARAKKNIVGEKEETGRGPERLRGLAADQLEEMASQDFFLGGRYGNKVAQQLAVQTNPYAKMCGAIVKEAMRKEVEG